MFDPAKVARVPAQGENYYWADFVELLCMTDVDGQFSAAQLAEVADFADDFWATSPDAQDGDTSDVLEALVGSLAASTDSATTEDFPDEIEAADELDEEDEGVEYGTYGRATELTDNRYRWCQDIFRLVADREKSLGSAYPFTVDAVRMRIELNVADPSSRRYIFYLLCSSLNTVPSGTMQQLTSWFEVVSAEVLQELLPAPAQIDLYGTARGLRQSQFTGDEYTRLASLASALRGIPIADPTDFHPRDNGDNGLDLVAWLPMLDSSKGVPSFFAQCACGKRWDGKQYEASYERWKEFIVLTSPPTKITFIAHHFRRAGEHWYAESDVSGVLVDRLRALRLVPAPLQQPEVAALVDTALSFKRAVV